MSTQQSLTGWFEDKVDDAWFDSIEVTYDDQEILVVGHLPKDGKSAIDTHRESTRGARMEIAAEAERLFNRKVSWGVRAGDTEKMFTGLGVPVMTRLRLRERSLLDTLVRSGVARSRSEALAWCVSLVRSKQADWLAELDEATGKVDAVRERGPKP